MLAMNNNYRLLLIKYAGDNKLIELLNECFLDLLRERENIFVTSKQYPQDRNLIGKLKMDLQSAKDGIDNRK